MKIRGKWRYLYRAIDKCGNLVDFLLTAKRDLDGANTFASAIKTSVDSGLLHPDLVHYVTKHLQQGIESDHFRVKKNMPAIGGFQSFNTARRTIAGFEAMLWLRKGFGFSGGWIANNTRTICLRASSDLKRLTKHENQPRNGLILTALKVCDKPATIDMITSTQPRHKNLILIVEQSPRKARRRTRHRPGRA